MNDTLIEFITKFRSLGSIADPSHEKRGIWDDGVARYTYGCGLNFPWNREGSSSTATLRFSKHRKHVASCGMQIQLQLKILLNYYSYLSIQIPNKDIRHFRIKM